jgi:LemA protein
MRKWIIWLFLAALLSGCGYNVIQQKDEAVNAAWSEVLNQYKRRADLVPNLVNTVRGYASHEERVLTEVTQARAQVSSLQATPALVNDPQAFARFQQAQANLTGALSRLLVVSENYPNLKADTSFRDLQAQLEGTENRIAVARGRYIQAVQDYNTYIRQFPQNLTAMAFHYAPKPNFTVENERAIQQPPAVEFNTQTPQQPGVAPAAPPAGQPAPAAPARQPAPAAPAAAAG